MTGSSLNFDFKKAVLQLKHLKKGLLYPDLCPSVYVNKIKGFTVPRKSLGTFGLFSHKMAFLKSKFKDDLVRVQRHTVRHFKDLE